MTGWSGKLVLLPALAVMPPQGIAATLADLLCDPGGQTHQMHANDGHDRGAHQDGGQDQGGAGGNSAWHPFHSTVFGTVVVTSLAVAPDFPFRALAPDPSHDLFVPEQPQRPPLS